MIHLSTIMDSVRAGKSRPRESLHEIEADNAPMRVCSRCRRRKPAGAFYENRRGSVCRECHATYVRRRRHEAGKSEQRREAERRLAAYLIKTAPPEPRPRRRFGRYALFPDPENGEFPTTEDKVMRLYSESDLTRMGFGSRTSIRRWQAQGLFPNPIIIGKRSRRYTEQMLVGIERPRPRPRPGVAIRPSPAE